MKLIGNKVWRWANNGVIDDPNEEWFPKYVWSLWFNRWTGTFFSFTQLCILYYLIMYVYILITFSFYACIWNMKIWNEINSIKKIFQITQEHYLLKMMKIWGMEATWATTSVQAIHDDQYTKMLLLQVVCFWFFICEKKTFSVIMWTYHPNWMRISNQ